MMNHFKFSQEEKKRETIIQSIQQQKFHHGLVREEGPTDDKPVLWEHPDKKVVFNTNMSPCASTNEYGRYYALKTWMTSKITFMVKGAYGVTKTSKFRMLYLKYL